MISLAYLYYAICKQYSKKIWRNKLFVIFEIYFIFCLAICKRLIMLFIGSETWNSRSFPASASPP